MFVQLILKDLVILNLVFVAERTNRFAKTGSGKTFFCKMPMSDSCWRRKWGKTCWTWLTLHLFSCSDLPAFCSTFSGGDNRLKFWKIPVRPFLGSGIAVEETSSVPSMMKAQTFRGEGQRLRPEPFAGYALSYLIYLLHCRSRNPLHPTVSCENGTSLYNRLLPVSPACDWNHKAQAWHEDLCDTPVECLKYISRPLDSLDLRMVLWADFAVQTVGRYSQWQAWPLPLSDSPTVVGVGSWFFVNT